MFNIDYYSQSLVIGEKNILFAFEYKQNIHQSISYQDHLYLLTRPKVTISLSKDYIPYNTNNLLCFNLEGRLLWRSGSFDPTITVKMVELPADYISIKDDSLKAFYQSDHEVWHDLLTGEIMKVDHVFKKQFIEKNKFLPSARITLFQR